MSLIELLVITGAVLVLGAVLTPVFREAVPHDNETRSLDYIAWVEKGMRLYEQDYDETRVGRQTVNHTVCVNWKQIIDPYIVDPQVFEDDGNPARAFDDAFSLPPVRVVICMANSGLDGIRRHHRGFAWNNLFGARPGLNYFDNGGLPLSEVEDPATAGDLSESKDLFTDEGPFSEWNENVDAETAWLGAANPTTKLQWNLSGDHDRNLGMSAAFVDGHAHSITYAGLCDPWIKVPTPGSATGATVTHSDYKTFWNFSAQDIVDLGPNSSWMQSAVQQYCTSLPSKFR